MKKYNILWGAAKQVPYMVVRHKKRLPRRLSGRRFFVAPSFQVRPKQGERVWRLLRPRPLAILPRHATFTACPQKQGTLIPLVVVYAYDNAYTGNHRLRFTDFV